MTGTLASALVAAQADMPKVEADAVNPHFKSKFVSLDHLIAKTRPVLNKHGLSISQWPSFVNTGPGDVTPTLVTRLSHVSGDFYEQSMPLLVAGADMQKLGAALTYARRYAWAAALGISEQEDDDGNTASAKTEKAASTAEKEKTPGFTNPTADLRSDAQAKLLFQLATKLEKSGAITLEQLLSAAAGQGVRGAEGIQSICERVSKGGASNLIERLKTLKANTAKAAA